MGIDCSAQLVVGCSFSALFVKTKGSKIKYDENTGTPYQVAIDKWMLNGKPLEDGDWPNAVLPDGLKLYHQDKLVGLLVNETESHRASNCRPVVVTTDKVAAAFAKAEPLFQQLGFTGKLELYLTMDVG